MLLHLISPLKIVGIQTKKERNSHSDRQIVESLNGLRTTKVKLDRLPAIYATTGISEEIKQICAALEITVPEDYETAASLRKKLALRGELGSYFQNKETITTEEKKSQN